jgi:hypothetical protein
MYTHVSKCKNDKILKKEIVGIDLTQNVQNLFVENYKTDERNKSTK